MIRKEVCLSPAVVEEAKRIILASDISSIDDRNWEDPPAARQELEIKIGNKHIAFTCGEIGSLADIQNSVDPKGLETFYFLTQGMSVHFDLSFMYMSPDLVFPQHAHVCLISIFFFS